MTWTQRANFACLCAWLAGMAFMALTALVSFGQDFRSFYAAAQVFVAGGDPYDFRAVSEVLLAITGRMGSYAYYSPPWFLIPVLPLALIPYQPARAVWMVWNVALWIAGLVALSAYLKWPARPWVRWLVYLAATFLFAWITWRYEQTGIVMFSLLAFFLWGISAGHQVVAGTALALMLSKPTVSALLIAALLAWLIQQRRWPVIKAFALTIVILGILSVPLLPTWLNHLRDPQFSQGLTLVFDGPDRIVGTRINTTLSDWLRWFGIDATITKLASLVASVLSLAILGVMLARRASLAALASAAVIASFWVAPYVLQYDFPPLALLLFYSLRAVPRQSRAPRVLSLCILAGVCSVPFWERPISDGFWIVIGATLLTIVSIPALRSLQAADHQLGLS
jgi:alpha-1,2-mannosyltransferase